MYMKKHDYSITITNEDFTKFKSITDRAVSFWYINADALEQLYKESYDRHISIKFSLLPIYEAGRVDGIKQERAKRKAEYSKNEDIYKMVNLLTSKSKGLLLEFLRKLLKGQNRKENVHVS